MEVELSFGEKEQYRVEYHLHTAVVRQCAEAMTFFYHIQHLQKDLKSDLFGLFYLL